MPEKIVVVKESGENLTSNVVSIFTIPETGKKYIITTENAVDPHGLTVLHVSEIKDGALFKIATDEEWSSIKAIMRAIISGNAGSYQYLPLIDKTSANGQYSRDISVSASAQKQMVDNYEVGRKAIVSVPEPAESTTQEENKPQSQTGESIFPQNQVVTNEENEVTPGIAEVESVSNNEEVPLQNSVPVAESVQPSESVQVVEKTPQPVAPVIPVVSEAKDAISVVPANEDIVEETATSPSTPGESMSKQAVVAPTTTIQQVAIPATEEEKEEIVERPVSKEDANVISIHLDGVGSFAPSATLDEVVVASQNVFVDGVKNLVQSLTEKIYRDLRNKEVELKQREMLLNEREKMLNEQMKLLMGNKVEATSEPAGENVVPMVVEVTNDNK